jgi:hypothetical protein
MIDIHLFLEPEAPRGSESGFVNTPSSECSMLDPVKANFPPTNGSFSKWIGSFRKTYGLLVLDIVWFSFNQ